MFKKISSPKYLVIGSVFGGIALVFFAYMALTPTARQPDGDAPVRAPAADVARAPPSKPVTAPPTLAPAPAPAPVIDPASSSGSYLAGVHAETVGESRQAIKFYRTATQDAIFSTANLYSRMYVLGLTEGTLEEALAALDKAESKGGHAPLSKLTRAVNAFHTGDFKKVETFLGGNKTGVSRLLGPTLIAWARTAQGDITGGLAALDSMKNNAKIEPMRQLHAALILDFSGATQKAGKAFKALEKSVGLSIRSSQLIGNNLERQGLEKQALAFYQHHSKSVAGAILLASASPRIQAGKRPPPDIKSANDGAAEAIYGVSTVLLAQGSGESALALANMALSLRPDFPAATMIKAGALEQSKRLVEANAIYAKIPQDSPLSWVAQLHRANNLDRLDQTDQAVALLRTLAAAHADHTRPLIDLGDILRRRERFAEAITAYDQVLKRLSALKPQHWVLFYSRGIAYEQTQQWPKAEADFLKALDLQPEQPLVLNYLGYSWIDQGLYLDRALGMIKKAVQLRPRDGYIVDSLGWGLYRMGNFKGAVKSLERATLLLPADPLINDHFGDALWRVGRLREARFQWQRALDLKPDAEIVSTLREKLKNGLADTGSP